MSDAAQVGDGTTDGDGPASAPNLSAPIQRQVLTAAITSWALMAVVTLGITPVYPNIAHSLGLKTDSFGALLGISTLVAGLLQIPMGFVSDRFRLKYLCVVGLLAAAAAPAIWGLSPNYQIYAIGLVAMGISIVCLQAGFHTALAKAFRASGRSTALSTLWVATSIGSVASLLIFGQLGGRYGWRPVTLTVCWVPLLALPFVLRMPDVTAGEERRSLRHIGQDSLAFLRHRRALALSGVMMLTAGAATATLFLFPFVLRQHSYGAGATALLLVPYIVGGLLGSPLMGALADRFGPARPVACAAGVGGAALAVIVWAGPHPGILVVSFFLLGILANGGQAVLLSSTAELASRLGAVAVGSAMGICRLAQSIGPAVSPSIIGFLFLTAGEKAPELVLAAVLGISAVLGFVILSKLRPVATTVAPASALILTADP